MNNFKNYLQESSIKPAKLSSGRFSIGNQFRLLRDVDGLEKGNEYTLIPIDEECDLIVLGGIGEYSFKDQKTNKKYCIHAGPRIIDELFELIPLANPSPSLSESKEPQAAQAYPVPERVIVERIIVEGDKGERGERGLQGLIGPVGPAGAKGERGDKGDKGDVGERGERGEPGPIGPRGETGAKGDRGERGEQGPQGLQGIEGKQGPAGLNGDIGPIGPQGERGPQGEKGEKGDRGEKGEQGPQGLQGEIGPSGPAGVNGAPGPIGPKGEKGDRGDTGPRGEKGDTGDVGIAVAKYPLKLEDKTLSVEQKFFNDLVNDVSKTYTAQSGGGGNVDLYIENEKAVKNLRSINFTGNLVSVTPNGTKATVDVSIDPAHYGSFYDTTTQAATSTTEAYQISLNTTSGANGVSLDTNTDDIIIEYNGIYNVQYSIQFTNSSATEYNAYTWFRINDVDVPDSNAVITIPSKHGSNDGSIITAANFIFELNAGDRLQWMWHADSTTISLKTFPPHTNPTSPVSPSVILTVVELTNGGPIGPAGDDGRGISSSAINENGELILTYTDSTTQNVGVVIGNITGLDGGSF